MLSKRGMGMASCYMLLILKNIAKVHEFDEIDNFMLAKFQSAEEFPRLWNIFKNNNSRTMWVSQY